jgi:hypothetical protein
MAFASKPKMVSRRHKLLSFPVEGYEVSIHANTFLPGTKFYDPDYEHSGYQFTGQKIHHPFLQTKVAGPKKWESTITYRNVGSEHEITDRDMSKYDSSDTFQKAKIEYIEALKQFNKINEMLRETTVFHVKHDGSCGALVFEEGEWKPYARFDVTRDKKTGEFAKEKIKARWIKCEDEPDVKGDNVHWPHFRPCDEDPKAYKWYIEAFNKAKHYIEKMDPSVYGHIVSIEYMGKKFNWKDSDPIEENGVIVLHGSLTIEVPEGLRNFNGLQKILEEFPVIEGIVVYPPEGQPMKIRREIFDGLKWPAEKPEYLEKYGFKTVALSREVALI